MRLPKLTGLVLALLLGATILNAQQKNAPLTNNDVVKMVKAAVPETTIVSTIAASDTQFDLSSSGLQALNEAGVSSKVIRAMLAAESKKKDAAAAAAPAPAPEAAAPPEAAADTSPGAGQPGTPDMSQMMAQMPPAVRAQMEASMARRGTGRPGKGGPPSPSTPSTSRPGVPVPLDSPLYTSFALLKARPGYRVAMNMVSNDPKMAEAVQSIFTPGELTVQGNTRQYVMHYKMPAMDVPGTVDDWEIRAVVQDGRAARLITSPAVPRLLKFNEEKAAKDLAQMDRMAASAIARAAAEGPMGAIGAGMTAASTALTHVEVAKDLKMEKDMFSWKCKDVPKSEGQDGKSGSQLSDFHSVGDQMVDGRPADGYEFYVYDNQKTQGTVHFFVAKDTGLPLRLEMGDPNTTGAIQMVYSELSTPVSIEIPPCLAKAP